ncbi:MAG: ADP-ribosylglycohydrolase family protein [Planctomycetes bacterium]|nr:ADP-ribosylglycohydrolase family protein [Planctomycetota bacterium]
MLRSLEALATGDAFGQQGFRGPMETVLLVAASAGSRVKWRWTDDTAMALGIVEVLTRHGHIEQDDLADVFSRNYTREPGRGYGPGQHRLMQNIAEGRDWREAGKALFDGGSFGNGCAMRIGPLGAFFADDLQTVIEQAALATEVTHAHKEGVAGGIAAAVAAAIACRLEGTEHPRTELIEQVIAHTPQSNVRHGIEYALKIDLDYSVHTAVSALGNGSRITAEDTVPLCVWLAAKHLGEFEEAMWQTAVAGGDRDTNCAIVGGIIGGREDAVIPPEWLKYREPLPELHA